MTDQPGGICHYTSLDIPAGITVLFVPNSSHELAAPPE
jgi:hypothetical protein